MKTYRVGIIGDVHGQKKALETMIKKLEKHGVDRIISVGDLVDRGPESQGCVELVRSRGFIRSDGSLGEIELVLGNHEDNHIRVKLGIPWPGEKKIWKTPRYKDVYDSLKEDDWDFLLSCEYMAYDRRLDVTVVHGGVLPEDQAPGWYERDRGALLSRTGYMGEKGERLSPGKFSAQFWTEQYDGRFGRVVYGHTTFSKVRFTKDTVGVDGSKQGKLLAVVIGEYEADKTFEVKFDLYKPSPKAPVGSYKIAERDRRGYSRDSYQSSFWNDSPPYRASQEAFIREDALSEEDERFLKTFRRLKRRAGDWRNESRQR